MRVLLIAIVTLSLGAGATFAQTPTRTFPSGDAPGSPHDRAVVDCMQMWDSGTHMTKQEWSRACKRVQTRLDGLDGDAFMRATKTPR